VTIALVRINIVLKFIKGEDYFWGCIANQLEQVRKLISSFVGLIPVEPTQLKVSFINLIINQYMEIEAQISWISEFRKSKKGGYYRLATFKISGSGKKQPKVYLDNQCRNYKRWEPLLYEGNMLAGLIWKYEAEGIIDADSPVYLL
jgi:hypothetical protein